MEKVNELKLLLSGLAAALSAWMGWLGWLIVAFAGCMALDYLTGSAVAAKQGQWSSAAAKEGLWHKAGSIAAVLVALVFDQLAATVLENLPALDLPFTYTSLLGPLVLVWYILTELGSIVENAGALGAPIPAYLRKAIQSLHQAVDGSDGE